MLNPVILFRSDFSRCAETEANIASKYFRVLSQRTSCKANYVIGRYSVLPYYRELERDIHNNKGRLINSYEQHQYIANMCWVKNIKETPATYYDTNFYLAPEGRYVVKGQTNSLKAKWNTHMFANNKREALNIAGELCGDSLIGSQTIAYRRYIELKTYEVGINGLPFTHEFRLFFYKTKLLTHGYYWSNAENTDHILTNDGIEFGEKISKTVSKYTNFFVLDIAQDLLGQWWLIEVNDGQMSGLSMCDPDELYSNLKKALNEQTE